MKKKQERGLRIEFNRARCGLYPKAFAPHGWRVGHDGRLACVQDELAGIHQIIAWHDAGESIERIVALSGAAGLRYSRAPYDKQTVDLVLMFRHVHDGSSYHIGPIDGHAIAIDPASGCTAFMAEDGTWHAFGGHEVVEWPSGEQ